MTDNAFAAVQGVPARLTVGDLWEWRADGFAAVYPATDYALIYALAPRAGGAVIQVEAVADAGGWRVSVPTATSAAAGAGAYAWSLAVVRQSDGARRTLCAGTVTVLPNPALAGDRRSAARRMLDAINAILEGRITKDVESYSIGDRALTRIPFAELRTTRARLMQEVAGEEAAAAGAAVGKVHVSRLRFS